MLVVRLARRGRTKQPFYDIVVAEKARAVQKKYVKKLGYYNPLTENGKGQIVVDNALAEKFISNGAKPSQTVARLLSQHGIKAAEKYIEKRVTKPKKEPKEPEKKQEEPPVKAAENTEEAEKSTETEENTDKADKTK
jgi:small subunit ribosomal protein S16